MISRIFAILSLCAASSSAMAITTETVTWHDDAVLHDGRKIRVERTVKWTKEFHISDPFFGLPLYPRIVDNGYDIFGLAFEHPDTHKTISWQGERWFMPVLLDIVEGVPYLVILGRSTKETTKVYGCPELPYIYLKYEAGFFGKWIPVPMEKAPAVLRKANLSKDQEGLSYNYRLRSPSDIQKNLAEFEERTNNYFQRNIPRNYDEWHVSNKNSRLNDRNVGDCRPPRKLSAERLVKLPPAIEGTPEILKTTDYNPELVIGGDDWTKMQFDARRANNCRSLFRPTDANDSTQGQRFVKDSTGKKPVPFSRSWQLDMGWGALCDDDYILFFSHMEEKGKFVVTKYTTAGDMVYRVSFLKPEINGYVGYIRYPDFWSENGYLYFDWTDFKNTNQEWHVKRWMKMRMKEPEPQKQQNGGSSHQGG